jgi:hypothetical protein
MTAVDFTALNTAGLNLQAVLDLDAMPVAIAAELRRSHDPAHRFRQLILIGHAGKTLWQSVKASGIDSANPIDDFSVRTVGQWFAKNFAGHDFALIYPGKRLESTPGNTLGNTPVRLQALGTLAGWHHASPLMIGINEPWGTWYAYRVALLATTAMPPSQPVPSASPCSRCANKVCISSCPAGAMEGGAFVLAKCMRYRNAPSSRCAASCVARIACPVGVAHRYEDEQINHTYSISLKAIQSFLRDAA